MHHRSPPLVYDRVYTGRYQITISNCLVLHSINRRNRNHCRSRDTHPSQITTLTDPLTALPRTESRLTACQHRYVRLPCKSPGSLSALSHSDSRATDTIAKERNYGSDAEKPRIRCSAQPNRLELMERVLFHVGKFPSVPGRIWDHIPTPIQTDIVGMLRQLHALLD